MDAYLVIIVWFRLIILVTGIILANASLDLALHDT